MNASRLKIFKSCRAAGWTLLAVFGVMLGIFLVFTPKYVDDYTFMFFLRDWYESQGIWYPTDGGDVLKAGVPWDAVVATWKQHYLSDNCRLSNITVVFFELLPKWAGSGLAWLSWCYAMWGMLRLARIRMDQVAMVSAFIFLCMVVMPWRDNMGCMDYQFNYVLPSGMAVWLLRRLLRGGRRRLNHAVTILSAVLMGAWTEAFSVPMLAGLIFIAGVDRKSRCVAMWETIGGLCVGVAWLLSSPHFGERVDGEIFTHGADVKFILKLMVTELPGMSLMLLACAVFLWRKGWRKITGDRRLMFALVSGVVSFGICCVTLGSMRSGWWCSLASLFGVSYILNILIKQPLKLGRTLSVMIVLVMTGVVWSALIPVDIYVVKTSREYRRALRAFLDDPEGEIYVDGCPDMSRPFLSQLFQSQYLYWDVTNFQNNYFFGKNGRGINKWKIIPEGLKDFVAAEGERVPGNMGAVLSGDLLVFPFSGKNSAEGWADICFGRVEKKEVPVRITPFRSSADGKDYGFVILDDRMIEYHLFGISSMSNFKPE